MRERLGAQRVADDLLAEASQLRGAAAADADVIVAEAESVAEQLLTEAREAADKLTTEAQERADGILARAYYEAEDLQRHTEEERARIREEVQSAGRAEIEDFRTRSAGLLDNAEDGLRDLAPTLEDAVATVVGVLRSLVELRNGPSEDAPSTAEEPEVRELAGAPVPEPGPEERVAESAPAARQDNPEARPLGWLFRTSQA
jgi:vacuolar-type H+-ATPase subunit H